MSIGFDLLNDSQKRVVRRDCLAYLAYFIFALISGAAHASSTQHSIPPGPQNNSTNLNGIFVTLHLVDV